MAGIDYTIPGQFKGIQLESPMNQMAQAMQLQGLQQQQQMNALRTQEFARTREEAQRQTMQRNALARIHADPNVKPGTPEYFSRVAQEAPDLFEGVSARELQRENIAAQRAQREAETEKRTFELGLKKEQVSKETVSKAIADIAGLDDLASIESDIEQKLASGELTADQAAKVRRGLPADDSGVPDWQRRSLISLLDLKDRLAIARDEGKPVVVDGNLVSPTGRVIYKGDKKPVSVAPGAQLVDPETGEVRYSSPNKPMAVSPGGQLVDPVTGQVIFAADAAEAKPVSVAPGGQLVNPKTGEVIFAAPAAAARESESDVARLMRERAVIEAQNPNDPRLKTYDAAIAKATATNQPLSDLARKQNELADLEEQLKADPGNKLLQQRIKEYKDDIRKDTTRPVTDVSVSAPVTPVTIRDPNNPSQNIIVNSRDGRVIGISPKEGLGVDLTAKEKQTREAKYPQATTAIKTYESKSEMLAKDLEKLANHPGLSGISGAIYGRLPSGTKDSMAAQALYDSIIARGGFKELQDMRAASPTGGALGNVSNQEGQYLRDAFAPISRIQSKDDLAAALKNAANAVRDSKTRLREAYEMTYEYRGAGEAAPNAPAAKSDVRSKADAILGK